MGLSPARTPKPDRDWLATEPWLRAAAYGASPASAGVLTTCGGLHIEHGVLKLMLATCKWRRANLRARTTQV
jgi:hypothetical protein